MFWRFRCQFDAKRNFAMIMYSGLILGISAEFMYNHLFPMMFGAGGAERNILLAVKMTLFDGFINAPFFWLPPAYIAKALVYQYPIREGIQKYIADVKENGLLKKYWSLWLPMTMINFVFMPAHFRIAFAAGVSFFWMIILSIVANNEEQDPDSCPVEPERGMAFPRALDWELEHTYMKTNQRYEEATMQCSHGISFYHSIVFENVTSHICNWTLHTALYTRAAHQHLAFKIICSH